jgi:hypothetical protein
MLAPKPPFSRPDVISAFTGFIFQAALSHPQRREEAGLPELPGAEGRRRLDPHRIYLRPDRCHRRGRVAADRQGRTVVLGREMSVVEKIG